MVIVIVMFKEPVSSPARQTSHSLPLVQMILLLLHTPLLLSLGVVFPSAEEVIFGYPFEDWSVRGLDAVDAGEVVYRHGAEVDSRVDLARESG
jgi:hypothetical protein